MGPVVAANGSLWKCGYGPDSLSFGLGWSAIRATFHVGKEYGEQANHRQKRAHAVNKLDAGPVGEFTQYPCSDTTHSEGEPEKDLKPCRLGQALDTTLGGLRLRQQQHKRLGGPSKCAERY